LGNGSILLQVNSILYILWQTKKRGSMKLVDMYKKLLPLILLVPMASYGHNLSTTPDEMENQESDPVIQLNPSETLIVNLSSSKIMINHQSLQNAVGENYKINKSQPLGLKFHEESNTLDFSTIDGISTTVSLEEISGAPPNGLGPKVAN
jgi:hypothetical protein